MGDKRLDVKMVEFEQMTEMAKLTFISVRGDATALWIHRDTFKMLMETKWDTQKLGDPSLAQRDLREALLSQMTSGFLKWFDEQSNELMRRAVIGTTNYQD